MAAPYASELHDHDFYTAPLRLSARNHNKRASVVNFQRPQPYVAANTVTPPLTPQTSDEALHSALQPVPQHHAQFSEYWRAFYGYYPSFDEQSATVTLPLNAGDLVLVHSIHDNGWADGTLLNSGIRGWFPTNYCEPYDHESIRNLLRALTNFFDIVRAGADGNVSVFCNQDYMRGLVAGVRYLLDKAGCLSRDAPMVSTRLSLSRNRKALLSDLSGLVKIAKALQFELTATHAQPDLDGSVIDDMVLRAFKLVLRAVKFHDVWLQIVIEDESVDSPGSPLRPSSAARSHTPNDTPKQMSRRDSAILSPVTPQSADAYTVTRQSTETGHSADQQPAPLRANSRQSLSQAHRRSRQTPSSFFSRPQTSQSLSSRPVSTVQAPHRLSARFSHRISYASKLEGICRDNLASERLTKCHDSLLTSLGSFIGIHLLSRTSQELVATTQDCLDGAQKLVDILRAIWDRGYFGTENIHEIAETMFGQIATLVDSVQNVFDSLREPGEDFSMVDRRQMTDSATACIRAAGEVVSKGRYVLEMIGDFEFEADTPRPSAFEGTALVSHEDSTTNAVSSIHDAAVTSSAQRPASVQHSPPQPSHEAPAPPVSTTPSALRIETDSAMDSQQNATAALSASDRLSSGSWLPPLPRLAGPLNAGAESHHSFLEIMADATPVSAGSESFRNISLMSSSTSAGSKRDSEQSSLSLTSTRATSPEPIDQPGAEPAATVEEQSEDAETASQEEEAEGVLEKTFAHELVFNKEGQITGGTLPALVERLTTADCTPDALFVSTFYLTFRLFTEPTEFAQALIDRFEYIGENQSTAGPVRLRVYNIFKGWLESHWHHTTDCGALEPILSFASGPLKNTLPTAAKHLTELVNKVENEDSSTPLTPRFVSLVGKTSVSLVNFQPTDGPAPAPLINKSQNNLLKTWKEGKASPSILDFEPMELARQFTLKVSQNFCSITPDELLASEWTKKTGSVAVNVRQLSTLATDLANLVADSVLALEDPNRRAKIIKQWIKTAKACQDLRNYDSLIAIVCALNSATILRLKRTWDAISAKTKTVFASLNAIVDCSKNYSTLRALLAQVAPPCIPFVGMYLTDLTFSDAGNPNTRALDTDADGKAISVINFDKHVKTARIISDLQRFQIPYKLQEVPELQSWMQLQLVRVRSIEQGSNSSSYYRRSLVLEPRDPKSAANSPALGGFSPTEASQKERWGTMLKGALTRRETTDSRRPSLTGTE